MMWKTPLFTGKYIYHQVYKNPQIDVSRISRLQISPWRSVKDPQAEEYHSNANTPTPLSSAPGRVYRFITELFKN